jgi:hypothetical protein
MTQSSSFFQSTRSSVVPYGAEIYAHPSDVMTDPKLTTGVLDFRCPCGQERTFVAPAR